MSDTATHLSPAEHQTLAFARHILARPDLYIAEFAKAMAEEELEELDTFQLYQTLANWANKAENLTLKKEALDLFVQLSHQILQPAAEKSEGL